MVTAESHLLEAERELGAGHARRALEEARSALGTQPDNARAFALMGLAYTLMGEEVDARQAIARAGELSPRDSRARYHCYLGLLKLGDQNGARAQLTYFTQLEPDNAQAKSMLDRLGGPLDGLPPLPAPRMPVQWYDGTGHSVSDIDTIDATDNLEEPPAGPNVQVCPECEKRTWKGWVCKHCGANLPRV